MSRVAEELEGDGRPALKIKAGDIKAGDSDKSAAQDVVCKMYVCVRNPHAVLLGLGLPV